MQVECPQKKSPDLTLGESDQEPASAEPQVLVTGAKSTDFDQLLLQAHSAVSPSKETQNTSSLTGNRQDCSPDTGGACNDDMAAVLVQVAGDACNDDMAQQPECAEPKQATFVVSAKSASQTPLSQQSLLGEGLPSQIAAEVNMASTACAEPFKQTQAASLLHTSQGALVTADTLKQTLQREVLLQVWMLLGPYAHALQGS